MGGIDLDNRKYRSHVQSKYFKSNQEITDHFWFDSFSYSLGFYRLLFQCFPEKSKNQRVYYQEFYPKPDSIRRRRTC